MWAARHGRAEAARGPPATSTLEPVPIARRRPLLPLVKPLGAPPPQIHSMEDFISSGHEEEEMNVGGLPACFDPPASVGDRRDAEGGGRVSPREGPDAAEDVDGIDSYPSEAERIR